MQAVAFSKPIVPLKKKYMHENLTSRALLLAFVEGEILFQNGHNLFFRVI